MPSSGAVSLPRSISVPRSTWISPDSLTARIKDNVTTAVAAAVSPYFKDLKKGQKEIGADVKAVGADVKEMKEDVKEVRVQGRASLRLQAQQMKILAEKTEADLDAHEQLDAIARAVLPDSDERV